MKITRRNVLLGATAAAALVPLASRAQTPEIVIGALYPLSGASAPSGVDARHALETAVDIINNIIDLDLPLAKSAGLAGFGGAKVTVVYADHQGDPQKGRAEAERLITQERSPRSSASTRARSRRPSARRPSAMRSRSWRPTIPRRACIAAA